MDEIKRAQDSSTDPPEVVSLLQQLDVLEQTVDNLRRRLGHSEQERQKLLTTLSYQGNSGLVDRIFLGLREMSDEIRNWGRNWGQVLQNHMIINLQDLSSHYVVPNYVRLQFFTSNFVVQSSPHVMKGICLVAPFRHKTEPIFT